MYRITIYVGSDAIEWFVDNMVGITSVEKAQVCLPLYIVNVFSILKSCSLY